MEKNKFTQAINQSYNFNTPSIYLGAEVFGGEIIADAKVNLSLRMMTRHGLVTGATGSGKTRTLTEGKGAEEIKHDYGKISSSTSSTILRKIVSLEQQGVDQIFG